MKAEQPVIADVAREEGVTVVDLYAPLEGKPEDSNDGIHPNANGEQGMANAVLARLNA